MASFTGYRSMSRIGTPSCLAHRLTLRARHWWENGDRAGVREVRSRIGTARPSPLEIFMPYKANELRRHKIPKARYKIANWAEYDAALRRRGSLTVWVTPEALAAWTPARTGKRGRPRSYSDIAIEAGLCCAWLRSSMASDRRHAEVGHGAARLGSAGPGPYDLLAPQRRPGCRGGAEDGRTDR